MSKQIVPCNTYLPRRKGKNFWQGVQFDREWGYRPGRHADPLTKGVSVFDDGQTVKIAVNGCVTMIRKLHCPGDRIYILRYDLPRVIGRYLTS